MLTAMRDPGHTIGCHCIIDMIEKVIDFAAEVTTQVITIY